MSLLYSVQHSQKKPYSWSHPALFPVLTVSTHERERSTSFVGSAEAGTEENEKGVCPASGGWFWERFTLLCPCLIWLREKKKWRALFFPGLVRRDLANELTELVTTLTVCVHVTNLIHFYSHHNSSNWESSLQQAPNLPDNPPMNWRCLPTPIAFRPVSRWSLLHHLKMP